MGHAGLFGRKLKASLPEELLDHGADFIFQQLFRGASDDEVVRISNQVNLGIGFSCQRLSRWESFPEERFQSVQHHVRQRRRDDTALRRSRLRGEQGSIFQIPGFQPVAQNRFIHGNLIEHPFVADIIEAAPNIALQHPLRRIFPAQVMVTLRNGIGRTSARSETIGVGIGGRFRDGFQCQQVKGLHGAVFHRGNPQRSQFPIGFRDMDTAQRLRLITAPPQRSNRFEFRRRSSPYLPVHSWRAFAFIFRHSSHGQGPAAKRVGQQPLQSFHFVVPAFPCCLDDTRLQPPDVALTIGPVDLVPGERLAEGCTLIF